MEYSETRKELRFLVEAGATVEVCKSGEILHATTANMSGGGVLLDFEEPVQLAVGDRVICEFMVVHDADKPLPYWGVGNVARVENSRVAIELKGGGFCPSRSGGSCPMRSETDSAAASASEPDPR
jgi:hypothetical protein